MYAQQLNFYSFRKIKVNDTIRIDHEREKETANHWRFRHENFRRGHPELLTEIKRMNGQKGTTTKPAAAAPTETGTKSEVIALKKRIDEMTKNIDELTAMVQKVSVKQDEQEKACSLQTDDSVPVGSKRVKVDAQDVVLPDTMLSGMDLEEVTAADRLPVLAMPSPLDKRETSDNTNVTDTEFVEELFSAFNDEQNDMFAMEEPVVPDEAISAEPVPVAEKPNQVDPELMERLGDALMLLPKEIQTLIVDRLIAAIMSPAGLENAALIPDAIKDIEPKKIAAGGKAMPTPEPEPETSFPVATTLATLLNHYAAQCKKKPMKTAQRTIPVVPVHA